MKLISILALLLSLAGCSSMLFYPEPGLPFTPDKARLEYRDVNLTAADGTRLHGWWLPAKAGVPVKGTVLHLHGNGGNMSWHLGGSWWLPEQGYQVLMLDYRGYGQSQGEPSLPAIYQDIQAAFDWLKAAPEVQGKPLVVLGQSIGGALAVHYLAEHPEERSRIKALVLDGVPASYRDVARNSLSNSWLTLPFRTPLSWFIPDGDSAVNGLPRIAGTPMLIFHSMDDTLVPLVNGISVYKAAPPPRVLQLTRGGHVQTFADPLWRQVMLRYLEDPQHFNGLRRLAEVPNYPAPSKQPETQE
ncbi:alpha/beta hydrolase [Pseudomonas viridiflava]|uniref:alpha/beta hydrolase n=1 Tax=Pseudomonas viridiflava TaxID=33069 RepID=UPI000F0117A6|nr:alpha/beta hydrolase [Pseudomonas viridiflava]MEE4179145.1 alpha/beta hydrolase [Pseudomonas viridiflava]MEE4227252.1 alpha/beta hydrolase [Pseudomonas viridiflava]MEE4231446.1 alpha/beta hydrolase [Pseudomonas viridiflava]QVI87082.1 alpha/beta hydrolase [Pseudomonas viridiflava]